MPQFKLQFVGNHAPRLKSRNSAMERRLRVMLFTYRPEKQDRGLKARLLAEAPAILRWIIDGCLEWQQDGLGTASAIQQASERYFEQQDTFSRWLEERCVLDVMLATRPGELYSDYHGWCVSNGEAALNSAEFAEVRDRTPGLILKTRNGSRWIVGISLRSAIGPRWDN
jgi:putative DNA primase/helicase